MNVAAEQLVKLLLRYRRKSYTYDDRGKVYCVNLYLVEDDESYLYQIDICQNHDDYVVEIREDFSFLRFELKRLVTGFPRVLCHLHRETLDVVRVNDSGPITGSEMLKIEKLLWKLIMKGRHPE